MFLPERSSFPPKNWNFWYDKYAEYAAWYSGDIEELLKYYANKLDNELDAESRFWIRIEKEDRANVCHLPVAGDIAGTSADLLFSESPRLKYEKENDSGKVITEFIEENNLNSVLLESAELTAALSGCFLKLDIQPELSELAIVSIITPTQAFPSFFRGRLWEILFYREVKENDSRSCVYRLFENRKRAGNDLIIEYKLMKGSDDKIGIEVDVNSIEETATLNLNSLKMSNINGLGCIYIPNKKPNKLAPGSYLGNNDWSQCIPLMDSLDFSYTSWVRDIELGMGQVFIDEELTTREVDTSLGGTETVKLNRFSKFQRCFLNINLSNAKMGGDNVKPIEPVQFEMRVEEHLKTCEYWFNQIVVQSGYSPATFGINADGRAESGTALRIRERKSFLTREKKSRYWQVAIKELINQAQRMHIATTAKNYTPETVSVELEDSIVTDSREQSETIRNLEQARAISTLMKVTTQHPDWTETEIKEEVDRINKESGISSEILV
ncbi:MAG: phage portal protein [Clostridiales bacterium]